MSADPQRAHPMPSPTPLRPEADVPDVPDVPNNTEEYLELLRDTSSRATAFAAFVSERAVACAGLIRAGQDQAAFGSLAILSGHLQDFLSFLIMAGEVLPPAEKRRVHDLRDRLLDAIEPMHGCLEEGDLVELADTLEMDLVPALASYEELATTVHGALAA